MGQVTIYLDNEIETKMRAAAKTMNVSPDQWVTNAIDEKLATQWPDSVKALAGAWVDFPSLEEIRDTQPPDPYREPW